MDCFLNNDGLSLKINQHSNAPWESDETSGSATAAGFLHEINITLQEQFNVYTIIISPCKPMTASLPYGDFMHYNDCCDDPLLHNL